nr:APC family permease [Rhodococcus sp. HNM0569]
MAAIARSHDAAPAHAPVRSPLHALGRRQLSPIDLLGQSLSTIAPATGMVFIALWMSTYRPGIVGVAAIAGTTAVVVMVAVCIAQFTRRLAAAGSLYSFVGQGLGVRATLAVGAALVLGYLGISISVLAQAAHSLLTLGALVTGDGRPGTAAWLATIVLLAGVVGVVTVRGVRFATRSILVIESCSLALLVTLMIAAPVAATDAPSTVPDAPVSVLPFLAMLTVLSMAGFESAAFFGPESKRPLVTVTRTVLVSPIVVGALFVFAAWAAMSGRGAFVVDAYFEGTASGASAGVVFAVQFGMTCSWFASTLGCAQAGSRLLYSMGLEGVLPRRLSRVQPRFRTPHVAVVAFVAAGCAGASCYALAAHANSDTYDGVVEVGLVAAYTLVAAASLHFLSRIGESTVLTRVVAAFVTAVGTGLLVFIAVDSAVHRAWAVPLSIVAVGASGVVWRRVLQRVRPRSLDSVGVFDSVETTDLLPGSGTIVLDDSGRARIVADPHDPLAGGDAPR